MNKITYTLWPTFGDGNDYDILTREQAVEQYGETTISALETVLIINPGQTAALNGLEFELLMEYAPVRVTA